MPGQQRGSRDGESKLKPKRLVSQHVVMGRTLNHAARAVRGRAVEAGGQQRACEAAAGQKFESVCGV